MKHVWLCISKDDLKIERQQCEEEGKDLSALEARFDTLIEADLDDPDIQRAAGELLDETVALPVREDYPYHEPSDLEGIKSARGKGPSLPVFSASDDELFDKVYGAWLGRCCGCLLGKPVEGWRRPKMLGYLGDTGQYPLSYYISTKDVPTDILQKHDIRSGKMWAESIKYMPEDDDTNYTTIGMAVLKQHGRDFTPTDVANFWMSNVPILHTCTAERIAYRNFALLIAPPQSASFRNPYRVWIGAQIRADFFGYAAPGNPELAAEFAWRDACISHVKNGIYGEMWAAAMIATAFVTDDIPTIIRAGLAQVPEKSRLVESVENVLSWHSSGMSYDDALAKIHSIWDEIKLHDWCHTISNAMVVSLGLLWGELDYEKSITRAVMPCFDTDCNGATVGSTVGAVLGAKRLPKKWTDPLNDTLHTGVAGYNVVKISEMSREMVEIIRKVNS
jgi:hypothetical protein